VGRNFGLTVQGMGRFLPDRITRRELRALARLNIDAEVGAVSSHILQRLITLGLAKEFEGRVIITYDGILFIGKEKPAS
jgi:hypothetical protein